MFYTDNYTKLLTELRLNMFSCRELSGPLFILGQNACLLTLLTIKLHQFSPYSSTHRILHEVHPFNYAKFNHKMN